jgi:rubrerythrin
MSPELWIKLFLFGLLGALAGLAWRHECRVRKIQTGPAQDRIFRCRECNAVYTDDPAVERSRCPQCGVTNDPFKF